MYHLDGLPPLCLLHGVADELVPFDQSVMLDQELTQLGMARELYSLLLAPGASPSLCTNVRLPI